MINIIIGFTHSFSSVMINTSPIIYQNPIINKIFISAYTITPISWILCKDECIISFFVKKMYNPSYVLGEAPHDYPDLVTAIRDLHILNFIYNTNTFLQCLSLFVIQQNTQSISPISFYIPMILRLIYAYDIKWDTKFRKITFPYFQGIMLYSFGSLLYKYFKKS
jgi:hypothetical protein